MTPRWVRRRWRGFAATTSSQASSVAPRRHKPRDDERVGRADETPLSAPLACTEVDRSEHLRRLRAARSEDFESATTVHAVINVVRISN
jgi:hypothetical protein